MTPPTSASDITVDWLRKVLPRQESSSELVSIEVDPHFGDWSLLGKIARVKLRYATPESEPRSIIVKFQVQRSDWEAGIYRLLSEADVHSVPHIHGAFEHGTLILEDLFPARSESQINGCTLQQAQDVLTLLAGIHGRFWGDPRVPLKPVQFARVIDFNMEQCWQPFKSRYQEVLGEVTTDFEWMWHNSKTVAAHRLSEPSTLFHGDVHAENLLFGGERNREPVLIDWQLAGRGLAANDISFFLVKSLTVEQRLANEDRLLQEYFELLPEHAQKKYGFDHFKLDYRACVTRSMMSAVMLVGPRFADLPNRLNLADTIATRVIAAVRNLKPVDAIRELG
jgi:hypothetical protein